MSYNVLCTALCKQPFWGKKKIAFSKAGLWALLGAVNPGRLQKYVPSKGWEVLN